MKPLNITTLDLSTHLSSELSVETDIDNRRYTLGLRENRLAGYSFACDLCRSVTYFYDYKCDKSGNIEYEIIIVPVTKAFDCVALDLLIVILKTFGLDLPNLNLLTRCRRT